jgi:hypothetical protein
MGWITRIRLLVVSLAWLVAAGVETAHSADSKSKVVYLSRDVRVIRKEILGKY